MKATVIPDESMVKALVQQAGGLMTAGDYEFCFARVAML